MQKRGLISREHCESDRRGAFVVLSAAGRQAIEQAAPAHADTVRQLVFDGLSATQVKTLRSVTSSVLERLSAPEPDGSTRHDNPTQKDWPHEREARRRQHPGSPLRDLRR